MTDTPNDFEPDDEIERDLLNAPPLSFYDEEFDEPYNDEDFYPPYDEATDDEDEYHARRSAWEKKRRGG